MEYNVKDCASNKDCNDYEICVQCDPTICAESNAPECYDQCHEFYGFKINACVSVKLCPLMKTNDLLIEPETICTTSNAYGTVNCQSF